MKKIYILLAMLQFSGFWYAWSMKEDNFKKGKRDIPSLHTMAFESLVNAFVEGAQEASKKLEELEKNPVMGPQLKKSLASWLKACSYQERARGEQKISKSPASSLSFSPSGNLLAIGTYGGDVSVEDIAANTRTRLDRSLFPEASCISAVAFVKEDLLYISAYSKKKNTCRNCFYNLTTKAVEDIVLTGSIQRCIGISDVFGYGAFLLKDKSVMIWDFFAKKEVGILQNVLVETGKVSDPYSCLVDIVKDSKEKLYVSFISNKNQAIKANLTDKTETVLKKIKPKLQASNACRGFLLNPVDPALPVFYVEKTVSPLTTPRYFAERTTPRYFADFSRDGECVVSSQIVYVTNKNPDLLLTRKSSLMQQRLILKKGRDISDCAFVKYSPRASCFACLRDLRKLSIWQLSPEIEKQIDACSLQQLILLNRGIVEHPVLEPLYNTDFYKKYAFLYGINKEYDKEYSKKNRNILIYFDGRDSLKERIEELKKGIEKRSEERKKFEASEKKREETAQKIIKSEEKIKRQQELKKQQEIAIKHPIRFRQKTKLSLPLKEPLTKAGREEACKARVRGLTRALIWQGSQANDMSDKALNQALRKNKISSDKDSIEIDVE